jgi:hypothetical protein
LIKPSSVIDLGRLHVDGVILACEATESWIQSMHEDVENIATVCLEPERRATRQKTEPQSITLDGLIKDY